jgi:hypothetical protein
LANGVSFKKPSKLAELSPIEEDAEQKRAQHPTTQSNEAFVDVVVLQACLFEDNVSE